MTLFFYPHIPVKSHLMSPLIIIIGISNCLGSLYYTPSGKRSQSAKYIITGATVNLILNLCFIPAFKAEGAVIASFLAELTITVLYVHNCNGYLLPKTIASVAWKRVVAGLFMAVLVYFLGMISGNPIVILAVQLLSGIGVYFLILSLLRDSIILKIYTILLNKLNKTGRKGDEL